MRIWMPYVEAGSGTDVFTERLALSLLEHGIEAITEPFPKNYQYCPWALKVFPQPEDTLLTIANSWNAIGFKRRGIPLISVEHLCVHDIRYARYRSVSQALFHNHLIHRAEAQGFRAADTVIAVSMDCAVAMQQAFHTINNLTVIRNGVDTRFFTPDRKLDVEAPKADSWRYPDDRPESAGWQKRLLFVGNPTRRKGSDLLIPIMERLGADWTLEIAQGREQATEFLGHPQIKVLGRLGPDEVRAAMRRAAMLLFPSRLEGLPLSAIEALACGLPVAAAQTSSLPEVVTDGVNGLLMPVDDVAAFAGRISATLADQGKALAMREEARKRAVTNFDARKMGAIWAGLIQDIAAKVHG